MSKHNKHYSTTGEFNTRKALFKNSFDLVSLHNAVEEDFKLEVNFLADLTPEELHALRGLNPELIKSGETGGSNDDDGRLLQSYPAAWDWRTTNVLGYVRNQASCGACYAFATT